MILNHTPLQNFAPPLSTNFENTNSNAEQSVNREKLVELVNLHADSNTAAIVPCDTTGESLAARLCWIFPELAFLRFKLEESWQL